MAAVGQVPITAACGSNACPALSSSAWPPGRLIILNATQPEREQQRTYYSCPACPLPPLGPAPVISQAQNSRLTPWPQRLTTLVYLLAVLYSSAITQLVLRVSSAHPCLVLFSFHTSSSHVAVLQLQRQRRALTNPFTTHYTARFCLRRDRIPLDSEADATDRATGRPAASLETRSRQGQAKPLTQPSKPSL